MRKLIYLLVEVCMKCTAETKSACNKCSLLLDACRLCVSMGDICTWPDPEESPYGPSGAVFGNTNFTDTMLDGHQLNAHTEIWTLGGPS